jgi:hypothetical protein
MSRCFGGAKRLFWRRGDERKCRRMSGIQTDGNAKADTDGKKVERKIV